MNYYFTSESRGTSKAIYIVLHCHNYQETELEHNDKFDIGRGSRSSNNAEFGHFTLLYCRGQQRNVLIVITHVHSN